MIHKGRVKAIIDHVNQSTLSRGVVLFSSHFDVICESIKEQIMTIWNTFFKYILLSSLSWKITCFLDANSVLKYFSLLVSVSAS